MTIRIWTWDELYAMLTNSGEWGDPDDVDKDLEELGYYSVTLNDGSTGYVTEDERGEFEDE